MKRLSAQRFGTLNFWSRGNRVRWVLAGYWLALATGSHWPKLELLPRPETEPIFQPDKGLHFMAFAGLTWLMIRARIAGRTAGPVATVLAAGCLGLGYAGLDELTQAWAQRDVTFSDFSASAIGVLAVVVASLADLTPCIPPHRPRARGVAAMVFGVGILALAVVPGVNEVIYRAILQSPWPTARIDKPCHFLAAAVMTWLLATARPAGVRRRWLGAWVTILVIGLSAPMMEKAQSYTGRSVDSADIFAHELGFFAALLVWALVSANKALRANNTPERPE